MVKIKKVLITLLVVFISISNIKAADEHNKAAFDITTMSIKEIQDAVDKGYLNYEQIVGLYLDRINTYETKYNALITLNEQAIERAKELDQEYKKNGRKSMIFGLPIIVNDNIDVMGMPTTLGTEALKDAYPKSNAPAVQKLIDAGAIIIAKANMSEFSFSTNYTYSSYGSVKNAYNIDYTSYGSSGGSAVAVATNLAVASLGTDTNLSLRLPASANSLVGIRPTYGIIKGNGMAKYEATRDTIGVITKYVEDNAIILNIIDELNTDYTTDLKAKDLKGVTIGVVKEFMSPVSLGSSSPLAATDQEIIDLMNNAIEVLEDKGAKIVYIDEIWDGFYQFTSKTFCYDFNQFIQNTSSDIQSLNDLIENGGYESSLASYKDYYCTTNYRNTSSYTNYLKKNKDFEDKVLKIYSDNDLDVVIYPTSKNKLLTLEEIDTKKVKSPGYTIAPATGMPSLNIPIGYDSTNLPYGMELLGKDKSESLLYKIGQVFETATHYYKNPDIAPSLYTIPSNISKLINYYETNKTNEIYQDINKEVETCFKEYNTLENDDLDNTIKQLLDDYDKAKNDIKENKTKKKLLLTIIIITTSIIIILCIIALGITLYRRNQILKQKKR